MLSDGIYFFISEVKERVDGSVSRLVERDGDERVQGRGNMRLKLDLLVQPDFPVGEQNALCLALGIFLNHRLKIMRESRAKQILTVGLRLTWFQICQECFQRGALRFPVFSKIA